MSTVDAVAALQAEIERREDEIVALKEVIAMLNVSAVPVDAPKRLPAPAKAASPKQRARARADGLTEAEGLAFSMLQAGPVSAEAMADVFGLGQKRHNGVHALKQKLDARGQTIIWDKALGYQLRGKAS